MLRRRFEEERPLINEQQPTNDEPIKTSIHIVSSVYAVVAIIFGVLLYDGIVKLSNRTPTQLKISDEKLYPNSFIGERAENHLRQLTSIGQKVTGSYENEVLAVDFLKREINFIIQQANPKQEIVLDHQIVSGSYFLDFKPYGLANIYDNVQNIVVRLSSNNKQNTSLLINCHFDSVPTSPGSSDDGINCVNMLEVLRVLSKQNTRPLNNIIFLFNGAEENPLQAAHGFITKHKWAKECRAVINLESAGAGGKEILFQAGPGNNFLIDAYAKNVPYPFGQSAGEEIFQSNIIPSDTDFRLFRDFGHIPGMDFAFFKNGYVYHTKYDNMDMIKSGVYQSSGENLLALVRSLSNSPDLSKASLKDTNKTVYFDFLGFFIISYSEVLAPYINLIIAFISLIITVMGIVNTKRGSELQLIVDTIFNTAAMFIGWFVSFIFSIFTAILLDQFGLTMSWYTRPKIIFGLYFCPTLIFSSLFLILLNKYDNKDGGLNLSSRSQLQIHLLRLITLGALFMTSMFIRRVSYIFLIPVIFTTLAYIIIISFKLEHTRRMWTYVYLIHLTIPTVFMMYITSIILQLFIPITGRFGSDKNPEIIVGLLSTFFCILIAQVFIPLVTLLRRPVNVIIGLALIYFITIGCLAFSNYGFPYGNNPTSPTPQRYWIFHSLREFHDETGKTIKKDSGYFFLNMDRNSPKAIHNYVTQTKSMVSLKPDCDKAIFCGVPIFTSRMISIAKESTWIPAPPPEIHQPAQLDLILKEEVAPLVYRYTFQISGPDHMSIFLSPKPKVSLLRWSFSEYVPRDPAKWNDRPAYFILYGYGTMPEKKYTFWMDMKVHHSHKTNYTMDIVVNGLFIHHDKTRTNDYAQLLKQFPEWTHTTAWYTQYQAWIY